MTLIDARHLGFIHEPPSEWPMTRANSCSIKFRIAVWAARHGWVRTYRPRTELLEIHNHGSR